MRPLENRCESTGAYMGVKSGSRCLLPATRQEKESSTRRYATRSQIRFLIWAQDMNLIEQFQTNSKLGSQASPRTGDFFTSASFRGRF